MCRAMPSPVAPKSPPTWPDGEAKPVLHRTKNPSNFIELSQNSGPECAKT